MGRSGGRWNPRTVKIAVAVVAIVVIVAGAATYVALTRTAATVCTLTSTDPLIFDQPEKPDTLDPHVTFSTPGWGIVQQVYQSLVNYNGTKYTDFVPVLAKRWTVSTSGYNYTFYLRQDVHFSNGHPFNAYVMWFSLYRAVTMSQAGSFIVQENFWYPGLTYYSSATANRRAAATMASNLNSFNFQNPTAPQLAVMQAAGQSFQVIDQYTIQLNMGSGYLGNIAYSFLLASIAGPIASAVDPAVVQANGGVTSGGTNGFMAANMVGTGPYVVKTYSSATGYLLQPDPNYWGKNASAAQPWNNIIQPAKASIQVNFQGSGITAVSDIKSGAIAGLSFVYVGPSQVDSLSAASCVAVRPLDVVYGSTAGAWWIYMNQHTDPFTDIHVRAAVVHAINYDEIISKAFSGKALPSKPWVGPVPPGYPYYNPQNRPPYEYNLALAMQEMNLSRWKLPGGFPNTLNYLSLTGDWETVALLIQADLAKIGIRINPVSLSNIADLYTEQGRNNAGACISQTTFGGGPFPIGQEFYTSDYISPDDWTQNDAISYGSANDCMAGYYNATMDDLVIKAAGETDPAKLTQYYSQMTQLMYDNYTVAWLVVPQQFQVISSAVHGYITNPMGAALPFVVMQNTMSAG